VKVCRVLKTCALRCVTVIASVNNNSSNNLPVRAARRSISGIHDHFREFDFLFIADFFLLFGVFFEG
jgi:hypothetical protein